MDYTCYECNKRGIRKVLSNDIDKRFIAFDGRCLCEECSKDIKRADKKHIDLIKQYQK